MKSVNDKSFSMNGQNPGCGGTEFVSIKLALYLSQKLPSDEIILLHNYSLIIKNSLPNLLVVVCNTISEYLCGLNNEDTVFICPSSLFNNEIDHYVSLKSIKCVLWLHHPFDFTNFNSRHSSVSCGNYQFYTNDILRSNHYHIQNIVTPLFSTFKYDVNNNYQFRMLDRNKLRIVYLGALVPGKGFHHLAKQWSNIKNSFPGVTLDVVGSTETYGGLVGDNLIPTTKKYASLLLKFIPKVDIDNKRVVFHGNVGIEKIEILRNSDVAILNPTGFTEAFPSSPIECMSIGLPVITSNDYGMNDVMCYFPELSLKNPNKIVAKMNYLFSNQYVYNDLCLRSINVSKLFYGKNSEVCNRWLSVINDLHSNRFNRLHTMQHEVNFNMRIFIRLVVNLFKYIVRKFIRRFF